MDKKTIDFYDKNYQYLIKKYDQADMNNLFNIFDTYIQGDDYVLDIGFGSGRDLKYISSITNKVYGLDASTSFVSNLKKESIFKNKVSQSILPSININTFNIDKFDVICCIAVFMHLKESEIIESIKNMRKILNCNSKVIISYSTKSRQNDERNFYEISHHMIKSLFKQSGFIELLIKQTKDGLNREIEWTTQVYEFKT